MSGLGLIWDGITNERVISEGAVIVRHQLADAAKGYNWSAMLSILREHKDLVNTTRPGGSSLFAPLHQAAYGDAPASVCEQLVSLGAWRMIQNARGERPVDTAERCGHAKLAKVLRPVLQRRVPAGVLMKIQTHFHDLIHSRVEELVRNAHLRLPELAPLLELSSDSEPTWFAVPGMYGGFAYSLQSDGVDAVLVSSSWWRVVEGSGQRHEITSGGSRLIEEGFV